MDSFKQRLEQLSRVERFLAIAFLFFGVVSIAGFICALVSFFIANNNQSFMNDIIANYENGTKYTFDDCFICTEDGCGEGIPPTTPCIIIQEEFRMNNFLQQSVAVTTPITIGSVEFPASTKSNSAVGTAGWFADHIRFMTGTDMLLLDDLLSNSINALQIGTFDYIDNRTSVCNRRNAVYGAVYYAVDPVDRNNRFVCVCVTIPPTMISVAESCHQF
jgi:hypothetical protein